MFPIAICRQWGDKWQSKALFLLISDLHSSIVLAFSIAAYLVCVRPELFYYLVLLRFKTDLRVGRGNKNESNLTLYTPRKLCLWWVYCFHVVRACVRPCVRLSVTLCFRNILKSHGWIFIKPCKHVHICKTNTLNKKVRARGHFY